VGGWRGYATNIDRRKPPAGVEANVKDRKRKAEEFFGWLSRRVLFVNVVKLLQWEASS
jgi:hypothetical protein